MMCHQKYFTQTVQHPYEQSSYMRRLEGNKKMRCGGGGGGGINGTREMLNLSNQWISTQAPVIRLV
jgi:hypothetical protein